MQSITEVASLVLQGLALLPSTGVPSCDDISCIPLSQSHPGTMVAHISPHAGGQLSYTAPQQEHAAHPAWEKLGKTRPAQPATPHAWGTWMGLERVPWLSHMQMSAPVLASIFSHLFYCLLSELGKTMSIANPVMA